MPFYKMWSSRVNVGDVEEFVGEAGKLFYDEDDKILRLSDGSTPGGIPLTGGLGEAVLDKVQSAQSLSPTVSTKTISLNGHSWVLNYSHESINHLVSFVVVDRDGDEVSVNAKKTDNYLSIKSNVNLFQHFLIITYF